MPAAIESAICAMFSKPPRAAFAENQGGSPTFQNHLRHQIDCGGTAACIHPSDALMETHRVALRTSTGSALRAKRSQIVPNTAQIAMLGAPIPLDPLLPAPRVTGSAPSPAEESGSIKSFSNHAGPQQPANSVLEAQPEDASEPGPLSPKSDQRMARVESGTLPSAGAHFADTRIEKRDTSVSEGDDTTQRRIPQRTLIEESWQFSAAKSLGPPHLCGDSKSQSLPAAPAANATENPDVIPQHFNIEPGALHTDIVGLAFLATRSSAVTVETAHGFGPTNLPSQLADSQLAADGNSLRKNSGSTDPGSGTGLTSKGESAAEKNETTQTMGGREAQAAASVKPAVEKAGPAKNPANNALGGRTAEDKVPTNPNGGIFADPPPPSAQRDAQLLHAATSGSSGTPTSRDTTPNSPTIVVAVNLQDRNAVAKPDTPGGGGASVVPAAGTATPIHAAKFMQSDDSAAMCIGLRTENFGAVQVHTTISQKQVEVALGSERGDLRSVIASDLSGLQTALQQHDLRLHDVRSLEHASSEQNPAGHSFGDGSRHSAGNSLRHSNHSGREHSKVFGSDAWSDGTRAPDEARDDGLHAGRGLSIQA